MSIKSNETISPNSVQTLDPYTIPLESINLIEASAGTGKSWTVTLLYLRLILELNLKVDQILVVTFTDAATKELRDAVRERLVEALEYFQTVFENDKDKPEKEEYKKLYQSKRHGSDEEAIQRLNLAKLSLDEAAIFTIHSFCQRTLNENAFEAGLAFESELMDDDKELMQKLTDDFWRRSFVGAPAKKGTSAKKSAPKSLIFKLQQKSITPDSLLKDIRLATGKPYLTLCEPESERNSETEAARWTELETLFKQAINTWQEQADEITRLLNQPELDDGYMVTFKNARENLLKEISLIAASGKIPSKIEKRRHNGNSDSKLFWLGTKEKTKAKFETIEHSFFREWQKFLDCWFQLDSSSDDFINRIRIDLLKYLQKELPKEKQRLGVLSFDDLLLQLQKALHNQPDLAKDLRQKYKVALIDEFQDTDPIQYDIFSTIYGDARDGAVFLVGDPKQAIYSFRGGDIHTYLKAKSNTSTDKHYTLKTNWRSHAHLIGAFNSLYSGLENPFRDKGIKYVKVKAGKLIKADLITSDKRSSLRFWQVNQGDDKPTAKQIREGVAATVAGDIAELLNAANLGQARIGNVAITGGDIAVLVRSHTQGDLIKSALNAKGVASVQSSKDSIFETHEAEEMIILLTAIVEPQQEDNVRRALVTELMGNNAEDLLAFEQDNGVWEDKLLAMQNWHYHWKKQGFLPMMRDLMHSERLHQHLMSYDDGERRLTNILHLSEVIHHQSRHQSLGMEEVLRWLRQQQQSSSSKEAELRLESDEKLVKIVTIHKSKGLEYPIVYCPFVGISAKEFSDKIYTFYKNGNPCLEIGSPYEEVHKAIKSEEERAEDSRLLYVALTRAKYQCTVVCVPDAISRSADRTALGWLLTDGKSVHTGSLNKAKKEENIAYFSAYKERLKTLLDTGNISVVDLPAFDENLRYQSTEIEQSLSARSFTTEIKSQAQITSFSGLTAGAHAETADHDKGYDLAVEESLPLEKATSTEEEFPRGATAGSALHEIYENLNFTKAVVEQEDVVNDALSKWGFDEKYQQAANLLMENSLKTELFEDFSLQQLSNDKRLNEMEFYLPLERLQIDDLKQLLFQHLPKDQQAIRDAVDTLYFEQLEGYLKGFIDLIFVHDGQYYMADYKSNTLADYDSDSLLSVMADSHYYLQYLLYSVALHRYLQKRIPGYQWETHVGGVYYLFVRGMSEETNNQGVFFDKPSLELIEALDGLFMRLTSNV